MLLGLAVVSVPTIRFFWQVSGGGFPDSGVGLGAVFHIVIIGMLALMFAPACLLACSARQVVAGDIVIIATSLGLAHTTAAVGVNTTDSNVFYFAYPLSALLAAALIRWRGAARHAGQLG